jgi:hypothetical protein
MERSSAVELDTILGEVGNLSVLPVSDPARSIGRVDGYGVGQVEAAALPQACAVLGKVNELGCSEVGHPTRTIRRMDCKSDWPVEGCATPQLRAIFGQVQDVSCTRGSDPAGAIGRINGYIPRAEAAFPELRSVLLQMYYAIGNGDPARAIRWVHRDTGGPVQEVSTSPQLSAVVAEMHDIVIPSVGNPARAVTGVDGNGFRPVEACSAPELGSVLVQAYNLAVKRVGDPTGAIAGVDGDR